MTPPAPPVPLPLPRNPLAVALTAGEKKYGADHGAPGAARAFTTTGVGNFPRSKVVGNVPIRSIVPPASLNRMIDPNTASSDQCNRSLGSDGSFFAKFTPATVSGANPSFTLSSGVRQTTATCGLNCGVIPNCSACIHISQIASSLATDVASLP